MIPLKNHRHGLSILKANFAGLIITVDRKLKGPGKRIGLTFMVCGRGNLGMGNLDNISGSIDTDDEWIRRYSSTNKTFALELRTHNSRGSV